MEVCADQAHLLQVNLVLPGNKGQAICENKVTREAVRQLREYFAGKRKSFDLPLHFHGTNFQEKVWHALSQIPYGESRSYGEMAISIKHPKAYRAVGMANHRNPFMIIIPCHRVIGAAKQLVGFAPGLQYQKWLLDFEAGLGPARLPVDVNNKKLNKRDRE